MAQLSGYLCKCQTQRAGLGSRVGKQLSHLPCDAWAWASLLRQQGQCSPPGFVVQVDEERPAQPLLPRVVAVEIAVITSLWSLGAGAGRPRAGT